jgi:hypothetical protein
MDNPVSGGDTPVNLVERVKEILLQPSATWEKIAAETASVKGLYTGYVMILAAIPAVATLIGTSVVGMGGFGLNFKMPIVWGVPIAIVSYIISLVMVYIFALVIDAMAPNFGTEKNRPQAFKVAAYTGTAAWLAGIFALIPALGALGLLGLYSVYLLYLGLKKVMKAPEDKSVGYTAVVVIIMIVAGFVLNLLTAPLSMMAAGSAMGGASLFGANTTKPQGEVTVPGVGSVDLGKLQDASKQMETAASAMSAGEGVKVVEGVVLQALLPMTFEGASQLNVESSSGGAGGMNVSSAKALYAVGDGSITLTITDMGAAGALAAMGSALNVNQSKQTATGYEKITSKDGVITTEEYDNTTRNGKYSIMTGNRLMIGAEGEKVPMDKIKAAVNSIDKAKAQALMK